MEVVEGAADLLPPSLQVARLCYLHAHAVYLRLEVGVFEGLEVEESRLVEFPLAGTLLQGIRYLLPNLLVLLDQVIRVNHFGLGLGDLRKRESLPVDKQVGEVRTEVLAGLRSEALLEALDEADLLGLLVAGLVLILECDVGLCVGEAFLFCELEERADLF